MNNTAQADAEPPGWPLETSLPVDLALESPWFLLTEVQQPLTCHLPVCLRPPVFSTGGREGFRN